MIGHKKTAHRNAEAEQRTVCGNRHTCDRMQKQCDFSSFPGIPAPYRRRDADRPDGPTVVLAFFLEVASSQIFPHSVFGCKITLFQATGQGTGTKKILTLHRTPTSRRRPAEDADSAPPEILTQFAFGRKMYYLCSAEAQRTACAALFLFVQSGFQRDFPPWKDFPGAL